MNDNIDKHLFWGIILILTIIMIGSTLIYLQNHAWIIRFEMDDNTLEAIKSINWSYMDKNSPDITERIAYYYNLSNESEIYIRKEGSGDAFQKFEGDGKWNWK